MNLRERLKEAYENVQFSADITWTPAPNAYHRSNLDLYLTEHHQQRRLLANRPRTVRECIPKSRLAQYANYVYNESREMSYASSTYDFDTVTFSTRMASEPWELPEVADLFGWFLKNTTEDELCRLERGHESPLLNVNGFEDKTLKIQITEDRVKNIWNKDRSFCDHVTTNELVVNFFTSSMNNVFLFNNEFDYNCEWFRNISITHDFDELERLSQCFKDESNLVSKILTGTPEPAPVGMEPISTEILYSEVLQGLSPSRKFMSSFKSEQTRVLTVDDGTVDQESFTNYTVLNSQRTGPEEVKNDNFNLSNFPKVPSLPTLTSSKFVAPKTSSGNVYLQNDIHARFKYPTSQFQVDSIQRHTRTSIVHPFSTSYVQQTYVYSPVQAVQRWVPSSFANSYYPTQIFTSSWFTQNSMGSSSLDVHKIFGPGDGLSRRGSISQVEDFVQFKEETMEFSPFVEEHHLTTSVSEELEMEAVQQYNNSSENFYQELERQATEQYTNSPE